MEQKIKKAVLARRPVGALKKDDFAIVEDKLEPPQEGDIVVETLFLSLDAGLRPAMGDRPTFLPNYKVNETLYGFGVGRVVLSKNDQFKEGDIVTSQGQFPFQTMVCFKSEFIKQGKLKKVDPNLPPSLYVSILGNSGLTAYFGLLDIGQPKEGETVVVSGAGGGVGQVVGQIAKIKGCEVIGIAGSAKKIEFIKELGYDVGINYRTQNLDDELSKLCPDGIDVYFDNVGGDISDTVLKHLNLHARYVCCGAVSVYNKTEPDIGLRPQFILIERGIKMQGFIIFRDYADRLDEGLKQLTQWYQEGKLKHRETVTEGIENVGQAFVDMFSGKNIGKQLLKVSPHAKTAQ